MAYQKFQKEDRYRMKVDRKGEIKYYYPRSKEQKNKNLQICKENGETENGGLS